MQINSVFKLGLVALLSVTMVACSSTEEEGPADTAGTTPGPTTSGATTQDAAEAARLAERRRLEGITTFYFEFDKSDLNTEARDALVVHAENLKANPNMRVRLEGHASEEGTREYNLALGERRAQAVERYLQVQGVSANQMEVISYGEEMPAVNGSDEASRSKNRRVELKK